MRNNSRIFVLLMYCLLSLSHVRTMAQQKPSSATVSTQDQGPSLSVTMQFIQDKTLEWTHMTFGMAREGNQYFQSSVDYDKAVLSADQCSVAIVEHRRLGQLSAGAVDPEVSSFEHRIRLADITGVAIDYAADQSAAPWFDGYQRVTPPAVAYLRIESSNRGPSTPVFELIFQSDALAERYAKGLIHAVSLCHGRELPFEDVATLTARRQQEDIAARQRRMDAIAAAQKEAQRQAVAAQQATQAQETVADESDLQGKISQLRSDIESQEQNAENNENSANQVLNNCSGPGAAICQALGEAGAARFRQKAAQARNQADADREEIERLQGEEVQARQPRDTSYGGNLQQVATENGTSIQNAAAQQQANLQAMAAAAQQRQQAQTQARLAASTSSKPVQAAGATPYPSSSNNNNAGSSSNTASSGGATNSGYNPYSSTPAQGSYNPYTGTGTGSIETRCTDVTSSVVVHVGWHGPQGGFCQKELDVSFTDNNGAPVSCTWAYLKDGVWHNYGGGDIQSGQTVGGEWGGDWTCNPDSGEIRYMCFPKSETATKDCSKQLPSDWK